MTMTTKYVDIAVNLSDDMFKGVYHGEKSHACDIDAVLQRSFMMGVDKMILTGTQISGL